MTTLFSFSNRSYTQQLHPTPPYNTILIHPTPYLSTQSDTYYPPLKHLISHESIRLIVIHMSTLHSSSNRSYTQQLPPHTPNTPPLNTIRYLLSTTQALISHESIRLIVIHMYDSSQFLKSIIYPTITPSYTQTPPLNTIRYLLSTTQALNISGLNQIHCNLHVRLFTIPQIDHIPNN